LFPLASTRVSVVPARRPVSHSAAERCIICRYVRDQFGSSNY